jgi:hypothetical protein
MDVLQMAVAAEEVGTEDVQHQQLPWAQPTPLG